MPDHLDACPVCGFAWDAVAASDVGPRVEGAAAAIASALVAAGDDLARRRAEPSRWSMLEYAGHVRDVVINLRDRIVLGAVEDDPDPKRMYADARVDLGLYAADTVDVVAAELTTVAALFRRTFDALTPEQLARPIQYAWPAAATRTLGWVGAQTVHEAEHHLADIADVRRSVPS